jgi:hypothetical protein
VDSAICESATAGVPHLSECPPRPGSKPKHLYDTTYGSLDLLKTWFPSVDPKDRCENGGQIWRSHRGAVLWTWLGIDTVVFLINFIAIIVMLTKYPLSPGKVSTLYTGDCNIIKIADSGLHVLINVLSTLALAAANGCFQLTISPTRGEVYQAHCKQKWLDIGVPSLRNLRHIKRRRVGVCCLLGLSAFPIHFL